MRRRTPPLLGMASAICASVALAIIGTLPGSASGAAGRPAPEPAVTSAASTAADPAWTGTGNAPTDRQLRPLSPGELPPQSGPGSGNGPAPATRTTPVAGTAAACSPSDFGSRDGAQLVSLVKSSTDACLNSLFSVGAADAHSVFREAKMVTVADAFRTSALGYGGTNADGTYQLVLFLRAGYYVQYRHPDEVGEYGAPLRTAIRGGLDAFTRNSHFLDVTEEHGRTLSESVILIDSAAEAGRYLGPLQRVLNGYNNSWNASRSMVASANAVYTPLFRGHQFPDFVRAVTADPSILHTLHRFALGHLDLLGTDRAYLTSNAGAELARFLGDAPLKATARPLVKGVLDATGMTGPTARLWLATANLADYYDGAACRYYDICGFKDELAKVALPITHSCDPAHTIRAQELTAAQLTESCGSLRNQDAYVHDIIADNGPVADDHNTTIQVVVYNSRADYQMYAGVMFGIDTDNGGMYLEGDPSSPGNQARFVAYEQDGQVWNLNHEYTHYLDGRFNTHGDFADSVAVPTVWWIEGFAEYVSYSYRGIDYTAAITEAGKHTYDLSTLFRTTYENSNQARTYQWGYLAVRYMLEKHRPDVLAILAKFRTGDYNGAYALYADGIGTRYDEDFDAWLTACAAGACQGGPTATPCTGADTRMLGRNCSRSGRSAPAGGTDHLYLWLPAGSTTLTVTTKGGTGNADVYYHAGTWASPRTYSARSTATGTTERLTVTNTKAGYRYISLYGVTAFSGVTVTTSY